MTRRTPLIVLIAALIVLVGTGAIFWRVYRSRQATAPQPSPTSQGMSSQPDGTKPSATARGDVSIDPRRQQLIGVRTVKAERSSLSAVIRAVGIVRADETRISDVNVKIDGWIRRLFADYTGRLVERGAPLLTLYSPDLLAAQREFVLAINARDDMQSSIVPEAKTRADALVAAARQRLARWDMAEEEIARLEQTREPADVETFRSPSSGVVIEKMAVEGAHVTAGQTLFKLADLSTVWVEANVYEEDLPSVQIGDRATIMLDAYPGERQAGRVVYLSPSLDEQTRTNKVRFESPNARGRLKPGMFATVELTTTARGSGVTLPLDAVLDSGQQQLVFIAQGQGYFTPREVTTGRRLGDRVEITHGVSEGDEVASGAAFFLDSESQLRSGLEAYKPSGAPEVSAAPAASLQIVLRTTPDPPRTGEAQFDVTVKDAGGNPIADATVSVQLYMPAMPTMNMPAMRNEVPLSAAGGGEYRGTGQVMMAGRWEATVTVTRGGQRLGSKEQPLVAR